MADGVSWVNLHSQVTKADFYGFLKALDVWIEKPHVVNRRLMGALIIKKMSFERLSDKDLERFVLNQDFLEGACTTAESEQLTPSEREESVRLEDEEGEKLNNHEKEHLSRYVENGQDSIILRKLLPRQLDRKDAMFELVIIERSKRRVSFFPYSLRVMARDTHQNYSNWLNESESYCLLYEAERTSARVSLQVADKTSSNDSNRDGVLCPTVQWLQDHLLPKLCKWAEEIQPDGKSSKGSLRLVSLDQYTLLYNRLKHDFGEKLVKIWPERTDPQKFVYEDIAIACYLLILWEEERKSLGLKPKQSFVDLGCGNGLLVHILSEEGHPGTGIDVRRRKIWDLYGGNTVLQERALDPTRAGLFPDVDWLIGNHSDELTPWIPVMAARSSYTTRYFVLPCCLFDFKCKFVRKNNKVTQYRGYLDFVCEVGETCGFQVEEDALRIPSTKRICQIGRVRTYPEEHHLQRETLIKKMILRRGCDIDAGNIPDTLSPTSMKQPSHHGISRPFVQDKDLVEYPCKHLKQLDDRIHGDDNQHHSLTSAIADNGLCNKDDLSTLSLVSLCNSNACTPRVSPSTFQPRPSKEPMRNCTSLDRSLKDLIVNTVARKLLGLPLKSDAVASIDTASGVDKLQSTLSSGECTYSWRRGGEMGLAEVAKLFEKSTLLELKNECGGLQTLLRNHYYIFKVVGGVVQLRDWTQETQGPRGKKGDLARKQRRSQALWKTSLCWFYLHHPDGCPVPVEQCPFAHSQDDLRERPTLEYLNSL